MCDCPLQKKHELHIGNSLWQTSVVPIQVSLDNAVTIWPDDKTLFIGSLPAPRSASHPTDWKSYHRNAAPEIFNILTQSLLNLILLSGK